jgi:hypothetical protein
MNDIKALEAKYKELGVEIKALKSAKAEEWPKYGDIYFVASDEYEQFTYVGDKVDCRFQKTGDIFRTKIEAIKERETRKTIAELRAQPGRKKFVVNDENYCIDSVFDDKRVEVNVLNYSNHGFASTYFESKQAVQAAIFKVGEERILAAAKWLAMGE